MRMVDIIEKKKNGGALNRTEINFWIQGYTKGEIPDYQVSSLLMAIVLKGMNIEETYILTDEMIKSGETIDLSGIEGFKVDKHSTGGVGDKTSLLLGPMVAACGAKLAKMSGRGLGHTGGTLDKLESIPGFRVNLSQAAFIKQVNDVGMAIIGQTADLVPADKKLYALRDVTGTVNALPLMASSIMSKKLATNADALVLDVKVGEGSFLKEIDTARKLAKLMVEIGKQYGKSVTVVLSDMNKPLGYAIGNNLEVKEVIDALHGGGPGDLVKLCTECGEILLCNAGIATNRLDALNMLNEVRRNGAAFNKFVEFVEAQGGDIEYILHPEKFPICEHVIPVLAKHAGYIHKMSALNLGIISMKCGAGRETLDTVIDPAAGIVLAKKVGDYVEVGDVLATVHTNKDPGYKFYADVLDCFELKETPCEKPDVILDIIM